MENRIDEMDTQMTQPVENELDKKSIYPTYLDLLALFGAFVLSQVAGVLITRLLLPVVLPDVVESMQMGYMMLGAQLISMPAIVIFMRVMRSRRGSKDARVHFSKRGFDPVVLLSGLVMIIAVSVIIEPLLVIMPTSMPDLEVGGWPMLLSIVVIAPIFEEYICRGLLLESLRAKRGVVAALLLSSLFFSLMHLDGVLSVNAFFMGLVLGYVYIVTESLFAPIILHAINNTIAYVQMLFEKDNILLRDLIQNDTLYYIVYGVAVGVLIFAVVRCRSRLRELSSLEQSESAEDSAPDIEE